MLGQVEHHQVMAELEVAPLGADLRADQHLAALLGVGEGRRGDDGKLTKLIVKKGDRILFGKYSGSEVTLDGVEHLIMREDDILGILE